MHLVSPKISEVKKNKMIPDVTIFKLKNKLSKPQDHILKKEVTYYNIVNNRSLTSQVPPESSFWSPSFLCTPPNSLQMKGCSTCEMVLEEKSTSKIDLKQ